MNTLRTSRNSLILMVVAFMSYAFGIIMPGATGLLPSAIISVGAIYAAMGSENRTVKVVVIAIAIIMVGIAVVTNLFALGLTTSSALL